jgi:hypothetical protein
VVETEEESAVGLLPLGVALSGGKLEDFEMVSVGITEIEGLDAAGVGIPIGQALRPGRGVLHLVLAQDLVGAVHAGDDDRHVLKDAVVAPEVSGNGPAARGEVFG